MPFQSFDARMRWTVIAPLLVAIALLGGLAAASIDILTGARAFVGGESQWSKSEKTAVFYLSRYIGSRDPLDHARFTEALAVIDADRRARVEMDRPDPDLRVVRAGLLRGNNHHDDVDSMVRLYRRFRDVPFMAQSIALWAEADTQVDELRRLAAGIRQRFEQGDHGSPELRALLDQVEPLNDRLTHLGARFSATLGDAARATERLVLWSMLLAGGFFTAVGLGLSVYLMRREARTARALRESHERWTLAADAAGIGLFDWDLRQDRVALDARAARLLGLPPHDTVADGSALARERIFHEDVPALQQALRDVGARPAPVNLRCRVGRHAPRHLQFNARARERGETTRLIGIVSDVSDDVQAQQLRLDKEGAERANRAKSDFLSRVSHELRTPLNAVLGFSQLLHDDPFDPLSASQSQRMQHVIDAAQHLLGLINDLLDVTGLENETFPLRLADVALDDTLDAVIAAVRPAARAMKLTLACERAAGADALVVHVDEMRLRQGLEHVLVNAVKYNRAAGHIDVSVTCEPPADGAGGFAVVSVRDTGIGLTPDQLERLFQPFDRLGAENTPVSGSGLGLVITQQLMQRMGGSLGVRSAPGEGTEVTLRVPLRAASTVESGATAAA